MVKRSIQTSRPGFTFGIEHDHLAIRCARLSSDGRGGFTVSRLEEIKGDFAEDQALLEGFRTLKNAMGVGGRDMVVASLSGKQVYAAQFEFRRLGKEEMEQALRLELRKSVHFEVATSTLDYEFLAEEGSSDGGPAQILVALAANALLAREMRLLESAGMKASAVDVLPVAVANAMWSYRGTREGDAPLVGLHVGPQITTIVIDSEHFPFFSRNIHFPAEEQPAAKPADAERRLRAFADEIARSLQYYEKMWNATGFQEVLLLGDFLDAEGFQDQIRKVTGLRIHRMDLPQKLGAARESFPGKFDLAVALALRGEA